MSSSSENTPAIKEKGLDGRREKHGDSTSPKTLFSFPMTNELIAFRLIITANYNVNKDRQRRVQLKSENKIEFVESSWDFFVPRARA